MLYRSTAQAKADADAQLDAMAAEGRMVKANCLNCGAVNEFPDYLSAGKCGACGNGIPLGASAVAVPATPAINEVLCSKCGAINQLPNTPPPAGQVYICTVCRLPLSSTDPHQSYVERHNELAKQSQSWQTAGGFVVLISIIATIMYSCQYAQMRSDLDSSLSSPYSSESSP